MKEKIINNIELILDFVLKDFLIRKVFKFNNLEIYIGIKVNLYAYYSYFQITINKNLRLEIGKYIDWGLFFKIFINSVGINSFEIKELPVKFDQWFQCLESENININQLSSYTEEIKLLII